MYEEHTQQSLLEWTYYALGIRYTLLLPLASFISFVLVLVMVIRGRGAWVGPALLLILSAPLLLGVFAAIEGLVMFYSMIAMSPTAPKPSEIAAGVSTALVAPLVSMLLMVPSYLAAAIGCFIRALLEPASQK